VGELFRIFVDVLTPVFVIVGVGYLIAGRMKVDAGTLSKLAYWILGPAFIFDVLAGTDLQGDVVMLVVVVSLATMVVTGLGATWIARAMGRSRSQTSATMLTSVHGNVGNFGIAIAAFAFGEQALPLAGIVMVTVNTAGILVGVAAATSRISGPAVAIRTAFLAPMALAVIPAVLVNVSNTTLPVFADRPIGLLASALIPMMLLTLGIQLGQMDSPHIGSVVAVPIAAKLIVAPSVAALIVAIAGPSGLAGQVVIVQAAMPAAVFTSLVALEHHMEPDLVTTIVLAGTLVSVLTLPVVLTLV
jgi:hypothetical protein